MWARTLWPFSSSTRNMALGNGSTTVPSTRIVSSLGLARTVHHLMQIGRARSAQNRRKAEWSVYTAPRPAFQRARSQGLGEREHLGTVLGDGDRVLEVRRPTPVTRDDRP